MRKITGIVVPDVPHHIGYGLFGRHLFAWLIGGWRLGKFSQMNN